MKRLSLLLLAIFGLTVLASAPLPTSEASKWDCGTICAKLKESADKAVRNKIREASVTVVSDFGRGSGTLKLASDGSLYCITAAHVVEDLKVVKVVQEKTCPDGKVTKVEVFAKVLKTGWGGAGYRSGTDVAILLVGKGIFCGADVELHAGTVPEVDTPIYHCGTFLGDMPHSLVAGEICAVGRTVQGEVLDQLDCTGYPGSSGGGVFLKNGKWIGLLVRGAPSRLMLFVPVREVEKFLKKNGYGFLVSGAEPVSAPNRCPCCPDPGSDAEQACGCSCTRGGPCRCGHDCPCRGGKCETCKADCHRPGHARPHHPWHPRPPHHPHPRPRGFWFWGIWINIGGGR